MKTFIATVVASAFAASSMMAFADPGPAAAASAATGAAVKVEDKSDETKGKPQKKTANKPQQAGKKQEAPRQ